MKKLLQILLVGFCAFNLSCDGSNESVNPQPPTVNNNNNNKNKNLNISIFLDLSDRINPEKYPNPSMEYFQRDAQYINLVAKAFINHVRTKKIITLNDKIGLYFNPEPSLSEINQISNELKFHADKNSTKEVLSTIEEKYATLPLKLYETTIQNNNYVGSDIWGFFKENIEDYCIENDKRNILVILTDGYIYYKNSIIKSENQTNYLTPQFIRENNLNQNDWKDKMEKSNYKFLSTQNDLSNLEVLVIGINSSKNNPFEIDVIKTYWENWLKEMNVKNFKFLPADLPSNLEKPISEFIQNPS